MYFISIFSPCRVDSVIISVLSWCYWIYTVTSLHPFHQKFCLWMNNYKYHRFISQATDDVVKVEVWDVVDKGKWISRIYLSVCLSVCHCICLLVSGGLSVNTMKMSRSTFVCLVLCLHWQSCHFCTTLAIDSGQKYPLPECVGEHDWSV